LGFWGLRVNASVVQDVLICLSISTSNNAQLSGTLYLLPCCLAAPALLQTATKKKTKEKEKKNTQGNPCAQLQPELPLPSDNLWPRYTVRCTPERAGLLPQPTFLKSPAQSTSCCSEKSSRLAVLLTEGSLQSPSSAARYSQDSDPTGKCHCLVPGSFLNFSAF